jgi:hypothetical protein
MPPGLSSLVNFSIALDAFPSRRTHSGRQLRAAACCLLLRACAPRRGTPACARTSGRCRPRPKASPCGTCLACLRTAQAAGRRLPRRRQRRQRRQRRHPPRRRAASTWRHARRSGLGPLTSAAGVTSAFSMGTTGCAQFALLPPLPVPALLARVVALRNALRAWETGWRAGLRSDARSARRSTQQHACGQRHDSVRHRSRRAAAQASRGRCCCAVLRKTGATAVEADESAGTALLFRRYVRNGGAAAAVPCRQRHLPRTNVFRGCVWLWMCRHGMHGGAVQLVTAGCGVTASNAGYASVTRARRLLAHGCTLPNGLSTGVLKTLSLEERRLSSSQVTRQHAPSQRGDPLFSRSCVGDQLVFISPPRAAHTSAR